MLNLLKGFKESISQSDFKKKALIEDSFSYSIVKGLYQNGFVFPFTSSSVRFSSLHLMINDVILNERKNIIEFGSGLSTLTLAFLFQKLNRKGRIISVEDSVEWSGKLNEMLQEYDLQNYVTVVYAPLKKYDLGFPIKWYDEDVLRSVLLETNFDMVFIDGPMAYKENDRFNRYKALPFIYSSLKENFSIFIDDSNREGEKKIVKMWEKEYSLMFNVFENRSISYSITGSSLNILPY